MYSVAVFAFVAECAHFLINPYVLSLLKDVAEKK
jgi:hypothetical protein